MTEIPSKVTLRGEGSVAGEGMLVGKEDFHLQSRYTSL